ncbi:MAG: YlmC/YmxH family sporulation protein [Oscillospiraceae bacterium]|nr:YlmC/YmxH family sporulation protein [Oscillospiraceae bacterium]
MLCRVTDMCNKEVINVCDGMRLGCVDDVEVDTCSCHLEAIVIFGRAKFLGFLGHEEDLVIPWKHIEVIGEHTILVNFPLPAAPCPTPRPRRGGFGGWFK